jgi:predicted metal-binding membrane protein
MAAGYLIIWITFSVGAAFLQRIFSALLLVSPMMKATSPFFAGTLLIAAGIYQFAPLKYRCLVACSSPITFLMRRWREGAWGAFTLGVEHGVLCVGCCWALMLLLFAGGVMNLAVIGAVTAVVLLEKVASFGTRTIGFTGMVLMALGLWVILT